MVSEILETLDEVEENDAIKGLYLTGRSPFFSAGLDVVELTNYGQEELEVFWRAFSNLIYRLSAFPKPMVAGISGHCPAGGCVLALCADFRYMQRGPFKIGLNEVPVAIVVPETIFDLYAFVLGNRKAYQSLIQGKMFQAEDALEIGLIDHLVDPAKLNASSIRHLERLISLPENTFKSTKLNLKSALLRSLSRDFQEVYGPGLEAWRSDESKSTLKALLESLHQKQ